MSNSITLEGKEYVPATFAGKHFGYSKDYLLLLIKNGKIDGQKVGNKWYVNIPSAEVHFTLAKRERDIKRLQLSIERKRELGSKIEKQIEVEDVVVDTHKNHAILETLVIVVIGLSMGATAYLGTSYQTANVSAGHPTFFEGIAVGLYRAISGTETIAVAHDPVVQSSETNENVTITTEAEKAQGLVVLPAEVFGTSTMDSVRDSFSDEVEVTLDPENPDSGVVIPRFQNTRGEPYRFLMVPVNQNTGS